ncbi:hypothetical protein M011DRAFT_464930 [Sporormia fimetaria CBS 119925]|uniref:Uncharacterized protein n=1 Tax=Sporormia fimetaria CBS 119925 TaxID=1340428 RepID=A0A6A6VHT2_9PLEO|nr:hypothetical protein M011DRAFT_464930 [Sporormia fimetaria CBS 119925]
MDDQPQAVLLNANGALRNANNGLLWAPSPRLEQLDHLQTFIYLNDLSAMVKHLPAPGLLTFIPIPKDIQTSCSLGPFKLFLGQCVTPSQVHCEIWAHLWTPVIGETPKVIIYLDAVAYATGATLGRVVRTTADAHIYNMSFPFCAVPADFTL